MTTEMELMISSMIDTIIQLEAVEIGEQYERRLNILKSRGAAHSMRKAVFSITGNGIDVTGGMKS